MRYALVKITGGELYQYLENITLFGRIEGDKGWGTPGSFHLFGCKNEEEKQFYKGILDYDKENKIIGLQTVEEAEDFWINGSDGMLFTVKKGDYEIVKFVSL